MAFTAVKQSQMPSDAPGAGIFARSENKDYFIGQDQEIELFILTTTLGTTLGTIQTGFEKVLGGYAVNTATGVASSVIDVKPNATDPTQADVSLVPADGVYMVVIFGYKLPNQLV